MQETRKDIVQFINLQLASLGQPTFKDTKGEFLDPKFEELTSGLVKSLQEKSRLLSNYHSPVDTRIQNFIDDYLKDIKIDKPTTVPNNTLILSKKGQAREVSLPVDGDSFKSDLVTSSRIKQGILNNPLHDKRTTKGTFHIVEGDLPVPLDKFEVPKIVFAHFLNAAFNPSDDLKILPFTADQKDKAKVMASMLLRPTVCPEVKGVIPEKSLEVRFFVPGNLVSNLDFVESIFGNAGDPNLAQNDAALDTEHWTGHTGCIVLAPQLLKLKKKEVGLPHFDDATERQKKDGMCWKDENELYNDGGAFKITCRDERGVVITLIADNYYGYSKKEIKTQISYSANLFGLVEEEHAGGAIAFARRVMGDTLDGKDYSEFHNFKHTFEGVKQLLGDSIEVMPENYAVDKKYPNIIYIPEFSYVNINTNSITWMHNSKKQKLTLSPFKTYVHPTGNKFKLEKHKSVNLWRIVDTFAEGVFCHKPCTVSGGGKSEISKSMQNAITYSNFNIQNIEEDFKKADEIIEYVYSNRWKIKDPNRPISRSFLSEKRTLSSAVRLLTPSEHNSDEYNEFLKNIPVHIRSLVLFVKRLYRQAHGSLNWKEYMSVEIINGKKGTGLLHNNTPVVGSYVRIGFNQQGNWMLNKLRSDFSPCEKIQTEDDISASITLPRESLKNLNPEFTNKSLKVVTNCEAHLFQRPDEAVVRGYDKGAELDLVTPGRFLTNYELLKKADAIVLYEDTINFDKYTKPVQDFIESIAKSDKDEEYFAVPSHTRLVNGEPTKNPRYLEPNKFIKETEASYLADIGVRLVRRIKLNEPLNHVVNAVLPGRRNNPVDKAAGIRPLAVYNPIHYQETPELFMDFICSLTGKSPSTTGAGSEGALTKAPFNMLTPTSDLNNALLSHILTESNGFSTAAGYVGAENKIDHDVSLLIPEIWARLEPKDRDPEYLIKKGALEKLEDFEYKGEQILASRLGYRITKKFSYRCLNRIFDEPTAVFNERMLKPELQGLEDFVDGIKNICEAQQKVALNYFEDGSVSAAIPPLQILLHIMAYGNYEGKDISDPELRKYLDRDYVINSDWYKERLKLKQEKDIAFYKSQIDYLEAFISNLDNKDLVAEMEIDKRLEKVQELHKQSKSKFYLESLNGTIGADPLYKK
ncbi:hypothetical protein BW723_03070 [Polaribacter reichenbachii]|uniref:PPi-type phosphoenolpyruvate carboxykinase lobe 2 domain-containing protein n=1 Tax=Polaribacter reichenbachii TaxID=996801 RepID=A0A1B8TVW9_9FLAO|nr:hypothetical protein [Polaribacter reichenbachii]APZ45343.1 hypothetical protein BW723_03070 [Polaribacter reichenbachii]AUC19204.1 hypothetical protein BTO17_11075 [Polaribacter reichenbachii]OBY63639.1 hypothetical protein LPB301_12630 [Polaribacter reichenbachii]